MQITNERACTLLTHHAAEFRSDLISKIANDTQWIFYHVQSIFYLLIFNAMYFKDFVISV